MSDISELVKNFLPALNSGKTVFNATEATLNPNYNVDTVPVTNSIYQDDVNYESGYDAAFELQKNGGDLFDSRILDNACNVENNLINNSNWRVDKRDQDKNGEIIDKDKEPESASLLEAIVDSYDSELDLYIEEQLQEIVNTYGPSCSYNLRAMFGNLESEALKELAALGIKVDAVGDSECWQNRTYTFSLVDISEYASVEDIMVAMYGNGTYDEHGNPEGKVDMQILKDSEGNLGSIIFADCLTADGTAQGAELNLSSILDTMGYDLVSKADFIGKEKEYNELMKNIKIGLDNELYAKSNITIDDKYGQSLSVIEATNAVYDVNSAAPGDWSLGESFMTYDYSKSKVRSGNYTFHGGYAEKGIAIEYKPIDVKPDWTKFDINNNNILNKKELRKFEDSLGLNKADNSKKEKIKTLKEAIEKEKADKQEETNADNTQALKDAISAYEDRYQEIRSVHTHLSDEEFAEQFEEFILEEVVSEYDIDINDLTDEIK